MVSYPISVRRDYYRGSNPRRREKQAQYNRDAEVLEKYVNEQIKEHGPGVYHYYQIADGVGMNVDRVYEILFSVDCGSNGFTVSTGANGESIHDRLKPGS